jgi:hypothetical protein
MGRAAELIGATPGFLPSPDEATLFAPMLARKASPVDLVVEDEREDTPDDLRGVAGPGRNPRRDRGVYLARAAAAHAGAGVPEQAATTGMQALAIAGDTNSGRILQGLVELDGALTRWKQVPQVLESRATFDSMILHERSESFTS